MYYKFTIDNFRGFKNLTLNSLKRVNLISGKNNVGKTSLLEAFFIHCGAFNPDLILRVNAFRGIQPKLIDANKWADVLCSSDFYNFELNKEIKLEGAFDIGESLSVFIRLVKKPKDISKISNTPPGVMSQTLDSNSKKISSSTQSITILEMETHHGNNIDISYIQPEPDGLRIIPPPPLPPFPAIFLASRVLIPLEEEEERFSNLKIVGKDVLLINALKIIEPKLVSLSLIKSGGISVIHADTGEKGFSLPLMGEGMTRIASLILAIGNAENGVVLIDEVENGLHHTILRDFWKVIYKAACEFNTQIIATTHSRECINAAHEAFKEIAKNEFQYYRLDKVDGIIQPFIYDSETLEAALDINIEVR